MENQLTELAALEGADINVMWYYGKWRATASGKADDVSLKVEATGDSPAEVVAEVYRKFFKAVHKGVPALAQPVLEYRPEPPPMEF